MKFLIVDDHPVYIDGLKNLLDSTFKGLQVHKAEDFETALHIVESDQLDLILIDYKIYELDGFDLLRAFLARNVVIPIAMISGENDSYVAKKAMDLGACGFIPKALPTEELVDAIKTVLNGDEFLTKEMRQRVQQLTRKKFDSYVNDRVIAKQEITPRQMEVLKLVGKGYPNKRIAIILNLSVDTVKEHVSNLLRHLGVDNRSQCIIRAQELGLDVKD